MTNPVQNEWEMFDKIVVQRAMPPHLRTDSVMTLLRAAFQAGAISGANGLIGVGLGPGTKEERVAESKKFLGDLKDFGFVQLEVTLDA